VYLATAPRRRFPNRKTLGDLGAASGKILTPGQVFTFQFQNVGTGSPSEDTLATALRQNGYDVRSVTRGFLSNNIAVQIAGAGGDAGDVGPAMAAVMSQWSTSAFGTFIYQGATGPFWQAGNVASNTAAGTLTTTGIAPGSGIPGAIPLDTTSGSNLTTWAIVGGLGIIGVFIAVEAVK